MFWKVFTGYAIHTFIVTSRKTKNWCPLTSYRKANDIWNLKQDINKRIKLDSL